MSTFSGQKNSGMEIPDYAIERIARCLLPMIQAYYESDEGQAELAAWNEKKTLKTQENTKDRRHEKVRECAGRTPFCVFSFRRACTP